MPATRDWDPTIPADTDIAGEGDNRIRDLKIDITERHTEGGVSWDVNQTVDGRLAVGVGNGPDVYKSDKTTKLVTHTDTTVTLVAGATWSGGNITSGTEPGHLHNGTLAIRVVGALVAGRIKVAFRAHKALTLTKCTLVAFAAPATAVLRVSALRVDSPSATTNRGTVTHGAGATSLWLVDANKPQIAVGQFSDDTTTFDNVSTMAVGDELVFEIDATGFTAAADLTIQMDVRG